MAMVYLGEQGGLLLFQEVDDAWNIKSTFSVDILVSAFFLSGLSIDDVVNIVRHKEESLWPRWIKRSSQEPTANH